MALYNPVRLADKTYHKELVRLGHLPAMTDDEEAIANAVRSYQSFMGLVEDSVMGEDTKHSLFYGVDVDKNPRICDCPDIVRVEQSQVAEVNIPNGTRSIPDPELPFTFGFNFNSLQGVGTRIVEAAETAFANLNAGMGVNFQVGDYSDCHVRVTRNRLSGSTLALALLSLGHRRKNAHYQKYDSDREWYFEMLVAVMIHECLHTAGFSHSSRRDSILWPSFNRNVLRMTEYDKTRSQRIYPLLAAPPAPPEPEPTPPTNPVPPKSGTMIVATQGLVNGQAARIDGKITFA